MNTETMLRLAAVESLSPALQRQLWESGDLLVRRSIVKRDDVIAEIAAEAVIDPTLVAHWASVRRSAGPLLDLAVQHAQDDHAIMELIRQLELGRTHAAALAGRCGPVVGWYLVHHHAHLLDEVTAASLVQAHIAAMEPMTDGPGRAFEESLGDWDVLWSAAAQASSLNTLPILRAVASRSVRRVGLQEPVVAALERLDSEVALFDERTQRTIDAVAEELLRSVFLPHPLIERLAALRCLSKAGSTVALRHHLDLAALLATLSCGEAPHSVKTSTTESAATGHSTSVGDPAGNHPSGNQPDSHDPADPDHLDALRRLAALPGYTHLPGSMVARAALAHHEHLDASVLAQLLSNCRGPASRDLAAELSAAGATTSLTVLARHIGTLCLDEIPNPVEVYVTLAREGSREITDRNVPVTMRPVVVAAFRPLRQLLREPALASVAVDRIELLDASGRDTCLGLLGEWEGDLEELLETAVSLSRPE